MANRPEAHRRAGKQGRGIAEEEAAEEEAAEEEAAEEEAAKEGAAEEEVPGTFREPSASRWWLLEPPGTFRELRQYHILRRTTTYYHVLRRTTLPFRGPPGKSFC